MRSSFRPSDGDVAEVELGAVWYDCRGAPIFVAAQVRLPCHVAPTAADGDSYLYALLYRSLYALLYRSLYAPLYRSLYAPLYRSLYALLYGSLYALLYGTLWHRKTTAVQLYPLPRLTRLPLFYGPLPTVRGRRLYAHPLWASAHSRSFPFCGWAISDARV